MGKLLIVAGVVLIVAGLLVSYSDRFPFFGRLPGDFNVERGNFRFFFPLASSILLSILLSLIFYLINRFRN